MKSYNELINNSNQQEIKSNNIIEETLVEVPKNGCLINFFSIGLVLLFSYFLIDYIM